MPSQNFDETLDQDNKKSQTVFEVMPGASESEVELNGRNSQGGRHS